MPPASRDHGAISESACMKIHLSGIAAPGLARASIASALWLLCACALAQSYPSGPVKMIVPFAAEGSADVIGRTIASELSTRLGKPVTVDNRVGSNRLAGTPAAAQAAPDCHTLRLP